MRRLLPYLVFLLVTGGLIAFVYKDRIFPPQAEAEVPLQEMTGAPDRCSLQGGAGCQGGRRPRGRGPRSLSSRLRPGRRAEGER